MEASFIEVLKGQLKSACNAFDALNRDPATPFSASARERLQIARKLVVDLQCRYDAAIKSLDHDK